MRKRLVFTHFMAVLMGVLLSGSVALASSSISVDFLPLKYYFNGVQKFPPAGKEGFIYNGTTYVPLRFVAESLGLGVKWDGNTSSIYIGGGTPSQPYIPNSEPIPTKIQYMADIMKPYYTRGVSIWDYKLVMGGKQYYKGWMLNNGFNAQGKASFNLGGNYRRITGLMGIDDNYAFSSTHVSIYGDGKLIKRYDLDPGDLPIKLDLDVTGVTRLDFEFNFDKTFLLTAIDLAEMQIE
ncbi:MAG TPA: hypothetical protein GXX19_05620 [Syntrophomonadaceae bacterium]|nr:hypothetical protein [Syntrophomonadaceae bacterium]